MLEEAAMRPSTAPTALHITQHMLPHCTTTAPTHTCSTACRTARMNAALRCSTREVGTCARRGGITASALASSLHPVSQYTTQHLRGECWQDRIAYEYRKTDQHRITL